MFEFFRFDNTMVLSWGLAWLPVVIVSLTAIMMTMTYTMAVIDGDVAKVFPYIR